MAIRHVVTRGFIGLGTGIDFVPTAGYSSSGEIPPTIILGPFCVIAQQTYLAGAITGEGYTSGAVIAEGFTAGSDATQQVC